MPVKKFRPIYQDQAPVPKLPPKVALDPITVPARRKYNKDELKTDVQYLSQRLIDYLKEGDRFERLLTETKAKDMTVMLGILTEKMLLLEGQPTSIIGNAQHKKMDDLVPMFMQEMQRRGMKAELTERTAVMTAAPKPC